MTAMKTRSILEARKRAGLTQLKLCAKADIAIKTLAMAERYGPLAVNRESLRKRAAALGVPAESWLAEPR